MATLGEYIRIIRTAIYGKEMRPAIYNALIQSWSDVMAMEKSVDDLNKRIDALSGGGGSGGEAPDPGSGGVVVIDDLVPPILIVYGGTTGLKLAADTSVSASQGGV